MRQINEEKKIILLFPDEQMMKLFQSEKKSENSQEDQICFLGYPQKTEAFYGQAIDAVVFENFSEKQQWQTFIQRAEDTSDVIQNSGGKVNGIYGYIFLPSDLSRRTEIAAFLDMIETEMSKSSPAFQDIIIISDNGEENYRRTFAMLLDLQVNGDNDWNLKKLAGDWRRVKEEYLNSSEILTGGLIRSNVFPEDSYCYNGVGYAAMKLDFSGIDKKIQDKLREKLLNHETGWMSMENVKKENDFFAVHRAEILKKNSNWDMRNLLSGCGKLQDSAEELSRAEINARKTKEFEKSFHKEESIQQGVGKIEQVLKRGLAEVRYDVDKFALQYGPAAAAFLISGNDKENGLLRELGNEIAAQMQESQNNKKKRPVRQIVGVMSEKDQKQRINEWKNDFKIALESEIRIEIAEHFTKRDAYQEIFFELDEYRRQFENAAKELEDFLNAEDERQLHEGLWIEITEKEEIEVWMNRKIDQWSEGVSLENFKKGILQRIKAGNTDMKHVFQEEVQEYFFQKAGITLEACFFENDEIIAEKLLSELMKKSVPMLDIDSSVRHRFACMVLPESAKKNQAKWMTLYRNIMPKDTSIQIKYSGMENKISCIQTSLANSLHEWKDIWEEVNKIRTKRNKKYREYMEYALQHRIIEGRWEGNGRKSCVYIMKDLSKKGELSDRIQYQKRILLPGSGVFSRPYDFSDVRPDIDIERISMIYMQRILLANQDLLDQLMDVCERYRKIDELQETVQSRQDTLLKSKPELREEDLYGKKISESKTEQISEKGKQIKRNNFCKFCGNKLKKGTERYCPECGKQLQI